MVLVSCLESVGSTRSEPRKACLESDDDLERSVWGEAPTPRRGSAKNGWGGGVK